MGQNKARLALLSDAEKEIIELKERGRENVVFPWRKAVNEVSVGKPWVSEG